MAFDLFNYLEINYPRISNIDDLAKESPYINKLLDLAQKTLILRFNLTSVGIVLAINFSEQITGGKFEIHHWIN